MGRRVDKQMGGNASEQDEVGDEKEKKNAKREETAGVISTIAGNNALTKSNK